MLLNCGVGEYSWESHGLHGEQTINPKWNQSWIFIGRTNAEAKAQYFSHLMQRTDSLEKTLMLGKIESRRRRQQRMSWLDGIQLDGIEFEQAPGVDDRQGSLVCCSPMGRKELDTTEWLNWIGFFHIRTQASLVVQMIKTLPAMWETWVQSLSWKNPREGVMATHSSILGGASPWTKKPGGLQSMGLQRVGYDWATKCTHTYNNLISHSFQFSRSVVCDSSRSHKSDTTHSCIYIPSLLNLPPLPSSHHSRLSWSTRLGSLCYIALSYQLSVLHMVVYICWRRQWHPTPVFLPGKSHGQRSLVGYSLWGREESDTTERHHFLFSLSCIGEGNGNPLQFSCLENPREGGAWWAAVYGVAQSRTWLKQLSSSSSSVYMWMLLFPFITLSPSTVSIN